MLGEMFRQLASPKQTCRPPVPKLCANRLGVALQFVCVGASWNVGILCAAGVAQVPAVVLATQLAWAVVLAPAWPKNAPPVLFGGGP